MFSLCTLKIKLASLNLQYSLIKVDPETNKQNGIYYAAQTEKAIKKCTGGKGKFGMNRYTLLFIK